MLLAETAAAMLETLAPCLAVRRIDFSAFDLPAPAATPNRALHDLCEYFAACDGVILSADEYTGSYSAVLRLALRWVAMSETAEAPLITGKPVFLAGFAGHGINGMRGLPAIAYLLERLGARVRTVQISRGTEYASTVRDGRLSAQARARLSNALAEWLSNHSSAAAKLP